MRRRNPELFGEDLSQIAEMGAGAVGTQMLYSAVVRPMAGSVVSNGIADAAATGATAWGLGWLAAKLGQGALGRRLRQGGMVIAVLKAGSQFLPIGVTVTAPNLPFPNISFGGALPPAPNGKIAVEPAPTRLMGVGSMGL